MPEARTQPMKDEKASIETQPVSPTAVGREPEVGHGAFLIGLWLPGLFYPFIYLFFKMDFKISISRFVLQFQFIFSPVKLL